MSLPAYAAALRPYRLRGRILAAWENSSASDRAEGIAWYQNAHALALEIGSGDAATGAGILAALSPRIAWPQNVAAARAVVAGGKRKVPALGGSVRKARRILAGEAPELVLSGPKVLSFYASILGPGPAVCIDRHAGRVALGWSMTADEVAVWLSRVGVYSRIAGAYRDVAHRIGMAPRDLEAVTWVWYRRVHVG